ncbi:MAG TPA: hypothetical protein VJ924_15025 [Alphaproteobacteria bacterium]|nr:hypothetical protein [Alphaproteobacteria bacterium]
MKTGGHDDDITQIEAMIRRQFGSLCWTPERGADWNSFAHDFSAEAVLYPASRPARSQSVDAFMARMKDLSQTTLRSFRERMLGAQIRTFGNVAMAAAACEITENDAEVTRGVEMMLLIKDAGAWRIVAQVWDTAKNGASLPEDLLSRRPAG